MLNHPTLDQIHQLGLAGMARAFTELDANPETPGLSHGEWLGLLLDREITARRDKRLIPGCVMLGYATTPRSRTSITGVSAALIGRCSRSSSRGTGSTPTIILC